MNEEESNDQEHVFRLATDNTASKTQYAALLELKKPGGNCFAYKQLIALEEGFGLLEDYQQGKFVSLKACEAAWGKSISSTILPFNIVHAAWKHGKHNWAFEHLLNGKLQAYLDGKIYIPVDEMVRYVHGAIRVLCQSRPCNKITRQMLNQQLKGSYSFNYGYFEWAFSSKACQREMARSTKAQAPTPGAASQAPTPGSAYRTPKSIPKRVPFPSTSETRNKRRCTEVNRTLFPPRTPSNAKSIEDLMGVLKIQNEISQRRSASAAKTKEDLVQWKKDVVHLEKDATKLDFGAYNTSVMIKSMITGQSPEYAYPESDVDMDDADDDDDDETCTFGKDSDGTFGSDSGVAGTSKRCRTNNGASTGACDDETGTFGNDSDDTFGNDSGAASKRRRTNNGASTGASTGACDNDSGTFGDDDSGTFGNDDSGTGNNDSGTGVADTPTKSNVSKRRRTNYAHGANSDSNTTDAGHVDVSKRRRTNSDSNMTDTADMDHVSSRFTSPGKDQGPRDHGGAEKDHDPEMTDAAADTGMVARNWSGIKNIGGTCYFACLMQILKTITMECPDFLEGISQGCLNYPNPGYFLPGVLHSLVYDGPDQPCMDVSAVVFNKSRLVDDLGGGRFTQGQQDPQEVMVFLLEEIHAHFLSCPPFTKYQHCALPAEENADYDRIGKENSQKDLVSLQEPVTKLPRNLVGLATQVDVTCLACKNVSSNHSVETFLPLVTMNQTSLTEMLTEHLSETTVSRDCEKCKCQNASKKTVVTHVPKLLTIQLGRFTHGTKDTRRIVFPLTMNASDDGSRVYDLIGYISHEGQSLHDGHYYAKAKRGDEWYSFNDCTVTSMPTPNQSLESPNVYLLYYKMREDNTGGTGGKNEF